MQDKIPTQGKLVQPLRIEAHLWKMLGPVKLKNNLPSAFSAQQFAKAGCFKLVHQTRHRLLGAIQLL